MKKLILFLTISLLTTICFAEDKVRVSVQYRQYLYTCPDGEEILVDDNTRQYECKSGAIVGEGQYKDVGGSLSFLKTEFDALKPEDIESLKSERITQRIYDVKNPQPYVEPTVEDYTSMIESRLQEVEQYSTELSKIATVEELQAVKTSIESKAVSLQTSITEKTLIAEPIEKEIVK